MWAASTARPWAKVTAFVEQGGMLLRFAGSRLAAGNDELVPVRLRRGGRSLGGTLSWDTPKTFAPFTRESPFFGLAVPDEIGIRRQILAEPDGDLQSRTWAVARRRNADRDRRQARRRPDRALPRHRRHHLVEPAPVGPVRRHAAPDHVALAGAPSDVGAEARNAENETVAPRLTLDGYRHLHLAARRPPAR